MLKSTNLIIKSIKINIKCNILSKIKYKLKIITKKEITRSNCFI